MSYVKIWLHCVWSTKNRECFIPLSFRPALLSHIRDYAKENGIMLDYINARPDHVHALIIMGKQQSVAEIMNRIKGESSFWINRLKLTPAHFIWQDDYFAASVSHSHVDRVRRYIKNQDQHHKNFTCDEEINRFQEQYGFGIEQE